ncbi:MAG: GNAT family N-acetyltransferase, partial [Chloroflexota bacterium]
MLTCRLEVRRETFDSVGDDWRSLLGQLPESSVFATPEWQQAWWECFKDGLDLKLMSLRVEGEVRGVAPLVAREGEYTFLGDADLVDYHELLHAGVEDDAFYGAILERLSKCSDCTSLRLAAVPEWSPSLEALPRCARELGWRVEVSQSDVAPGLPLPGTWEEYLAGLSKKDRHELRRKMRRLESAGDVRQQALSTPEDVEAGLDDFIRLHRKSTPDKEAFMTPERGAVFRHAAPALA